MAMIQTLAGLRSQWSICHFMYIDSTPTTSTAAAGESLQNGKRMVIILKQREKGQKLITSALEKYVSP